MKKIYSFNWDCGRMGNLSGVFVADSADVEKSYGRHVYFGEVLGKHSEIHGNLSEDDFNELSDDEDFVTKVEDILGTSLGGFNPFDYLDEDDESEDSDEEIEEEDDDDDTEG